MCMWDLPTCQVTTPTDCQCILFFMLVVLKGYLYMNFRGSRLDRICPQRRPQPRLKAPTRRMAAAAWSSERRLDWQLKAPHMGAPAGRRLDRQLAALQAGPLPWWGLDPPLCQRSKGHLPALEALCPAAAASLWERRGLLRLWAGQLRRLRACTPAPPGMQGLGRVWARALLRLAASQSLAYN